MLSKTPMYHIVDRLHKDGEKIVEKIQFAEHVNLTKGEYQYLFEKYGERKLRQKIEELNQLKIDGERKKELNDYRSLLTEGMQTVEPIRDKYKIEEMKKILRDKSERDYFLFSFGINVGLRISDLLNLQVKDVLNKTHIIVKETKTKKNKRFFINASLQREVREYTSNMKNSDYLFPSSKGGLPITRIQAYRILQEASQKAGLTRFATHSMRKTFGYWYYQRYKDVAMLQDIFNHSAPIITLRYIGINQEIVDRSLEDFYL